MFDAITLKGRGPEIFNITIWPENVDGKRYSCEIIFNCGGGDNNLIPVIKDIVGTACPFVDTGKFKPEYLQSVTVTIDSITLSYRDPKADTVTSIDVFVGIDDIYRALKQEQFSIGVYLYDKAPRDFPDREIRQGDTSLYEAYDFSFDSESDAIYVSAATEKTEGDFCLVEMPIHLGDPFDE